MITPAYSMTATERVLPRLALDFTTASLDPRVTVTRALNTATRINSSGSVEAINANLPRFDFDPSTLQCKGLLIEEARTNSLPNNTMVGAVAGSPGTQPTGWFPTTTGGVFTRTIVGVGVENGIAYIDIRYQASGAGNASVQNVGGTTIAATNGQTWTYSSYVKLVGGSLTNVTVNDTIGENNAAGAFLAAGDSANYVPTSASLISQRREYTRTNTNASTAYVYTRTRIAFSGAGDVTLRFGLPQLELGAFATSAIQTSGSAVLRNADVVAMTGTNFSSWFNASEGAIMCDVTLISTPTTTSNFPRVLTLAGANPNTDEISIYTRTQGVGVDFGLPFGIITTGGTGQADIVAVSSPSNNWGAVIAYKTNNCAAAGSGTFLGSDVSVTLPTCTQLLIMGQARFQPQPSGWVRKINYWPQRLINAEVQAFSKQG